MARRTCTAFSSKYWGLTTMPADKIRSALPFRVIYSLISLCVIFSLTTLQHRAETVGRLVSYLRHLEIDVRKQLNLQTESTAFSFFRPNDNFFLSYLSFIYLMILLIPIGFLFANGIDGHWPSQAPEIWPIRSSTPSDIQMWVDRNFEFCVDMTSLLVVSLLLAGYVSRGWRNPSRRDRGGPRAFFPRVNAAAARNFRGMPKGRPASIT